MTVTAQMTKIFLKKHKLRVYILIALTVFVVTFMYIHSQYIGALTNGDTSGYEELYRALQANETPKSIRPPAYGALIALAYSLKIKMWFMNLMTALPIPISAFFITKKLLPKTKEWIVLAISIIASVDIQLLIYSNITTPEITMTSALLIFIALFLYQDEKGTAFKIMTVLAGALLFYIKPAYLYLPIIIYGFRYLYKGFFSKRFGPFKKELIPTVLSLLFLFTAGGILSGYNLQTWGVSSISPLNGYATMGKIQQYGYLGSTNLTEVKNQYLQLEMEDEYKAMNPFDFVPRLMTSDIISANDKFAELEELNDAILSGKYSNFIVESLKTLPEVLYDKWGYKEIENLDYSQFTFYIYKIDQILFYILPFGVVYLSLKLLSPFVEGRFKEYSGGEYYSLAIILSPILYIYAVNSLMAYSAYFRLRLPTEPLLTIVFLVSLIYLTSTLKKFIKEILRKTPNES